MNKAFYTDEAIAWIDAARNYPQNLTSQAAIDQIESDIRALADKLKETETKSFYVPVTDSYVNKTVLKYRDESKATAELTLTTYDEDGNPKTSFQKGDIIPVRRALKPNYYIVGLELPVFMIQITLLIMSLRMKAILILLTQLFYATMHILIIKIHLVPCTRLARTITTMLMMPTSISGR
jgi:hypothetical protein